jgi:argininosuccinate lyase
VEAAGTFKLANPNLPLSEAAFRRALTPENMVSASQGLGGPQPAEVARMIAGQATRLQSDRGWLDDQRRKLKDASVALDAAFAALHSQ